MARAPNKKSLENLRPISTPEEAEAKGRAGGIKSGEKRRKKKSMYEAANLLLELPVQPNNRERLQELNINPEDADNQMLILTALLGKAIKGDIRAAEFIRDTAQEKPMTKVEKAKLKLEKERLKIEKEKLELMKSRNDDW